MSDFVVFCKPYKIRVVMKKNLVFLIVLFSLIQSKTYASHAAGGEIFYQWTSANTYDIYVRLFRDCNPLNLAMPTSVTVGIYDQSTHATTTNLTLNLLSNNQNLDLGDSCYTPPGLCIDEAIFRYQGVFLPDNPNGYYLESHINTRNDLADNLLNPDSYTLLFFAMMPDPALGQNSSPDFGDYPLDSYFCTTAPSIWTFPVVDPDGDSLAYTFVSPLGNTNSTGTTAGSGGYPFYNAVPWAVGYSLLNIYNGINPMTIDNITGEINAFPNSLGTYAFVVRVEEFRNGVKLGEVRRDIQYASLACSLDDPPTINMSDTVAVYAGDSICVDVTVTDADGIDTLYVIPTSVDFDLETTFILPSEVGSTWQYTNWNNSGSTQTMNHFDTINGEFQGVGEMYLRYCWQPGCETIDDTYHLDLLAYSFGCSGSDTSSKQVVFDVQYEPAQVSLDLPDEITVTYDENICFELLTVDNLETGYPMSLTPTDNNFDYEGNYVSPSQNSQGYYYSNFAGQTRVYINDYSYSNGTVTGTDTIAIRYCWTPTCGDVFMEQYDLNYEAKLYTECFIVSDNKTMTVNVEPPSSEATRIPNVFTPNGDGSNDYFKLGGTPDPCYDSLTVTIYNRWGKIVYESNDPYFEWDGTLKGKGNAECAAGSYFVLINGTYGSIYDPNGEALPVLIEEKYTIQLLR